MKIAILVLTTMLPNDQRVDSIQFPTSVEREAARLVLLKRDAITAATIRKMLADKNFPPLELPHSAGSCTEVEIKLPDGVEIIKRKGAPVKIDGNTIQEIEPQ